MDCVKLFLRDREEFYLFMKIKTNEQSLLQNKS